jgi:uncharacterized protein
MATINRLLALLSLATFPCRLACQTVLSVAALAAVSAPTLAAQNVVPNLTVTGSGTVSRDPDRATLLLSIITNDDSATNATSQNNRIYNAVTGKLHGLGIAQSSISTSRYDVSFVPKPSAGENYKPPRTGFIVTRSLSITIDNLSSVGSTIDAAVGAGVTQIDGVAFGLRDDRNAHAAALAAAVHDANAQAAAIAQAAHLRLGAIRRIATGEAPQIGPVRLQALALKAAPAVPTEIAPSQVNVHATVTITYAVSPG